MRGRGRYGNVQKPVIDGHRFDSKHESERYLELKLLEKAGEIEQLEVQPRFPIIIGGVPIRIMSKRYSTLGRQMMYVADFQYRDIKRKKRIIEDVKMQSGHRTEVYKIKRALMQAIGYQITEV